MNKQFLVLIWLFCIGNFSFSQGKFVIQNHKKSDKIKFKLVNNLIIIPVEINGITLSFIVDTGVTKPMIFDYLNVSDSLKIKDTETIYIRGLGGGESVEALKSKNNIFKIGDAIKLNQDLYAIFSTDLNFAPRLGIPIHGIIGFDLFKDFVVEINYTKKYIRLTEPDKFSYKNCKKCETFNLEFYNNKPYINAKVEIYNKEIPVKLLIDTGGSDDLWLFENDSLGIKINDNYFKDFLGHGLSGSVFGKRSKVEAFYLKKLVLESANVAYPDTVSIDVTKIVKDRNGTVSGGILKRFNLIVNYQKALFTIKKNQYFNAKFSYNKSGIEIAHDGVHLVKEKDNRTSKNRATYGNDDTQTNSRIVLSQNYKLSLKPSYTIVELRVDSPAYRAGLKIGDVILTINGTPSYEFSLDAIVHKFYDSAGRQIKLKILRDDTEMVYTFKLEEVLKNPRQ